MVTALKRVFSTGDELIKFIVSMEVIEGLIVRASQSVHAAQRGNYEKDTDRYQPPIGSESLTDLFARIRSAAVGFDASA